MPAEPIRIEIATSRRTQGMDITGQIADAVRKAGLSEGSVLVFCPHTTAGVTVNERADPTVIADMMGFFDRLVPEGQSQFRHMEGNSDAHIKATLTGCSVRVVVADGRLRLGCWQGIFFCEFDGPRRREVGSTSRGIDK